MAARRRPLSVNSLILEDLGGISTLGKDVARDKET